MSTRSSLAPKSGTSRHPCFEAADAVLKPKNTELVEKWEFPSGAARLVIATRKINARLRPNPIVMCATYCPFCGVKLDEKETDSKTKAAGTG